MIITKASCGALAVAFRGCYNSLDEAKYQHNLLHEEVLKQQNHYEKLVKDVDCNVRSLVMDICANWDLANQVLEKVREFETVLKCTIQDVEKGKEWLWTTDNGVLVLMLEQMEKMEAHMAVQEQEIVELHHQVDGS